MPTVAAGVGGVLRRQLPLILAVAWCAVLFGAASVVYGGGQASTLAFGSYQSQNWSNVVKQQSPNLVDNNCANEQPGPTPNYAACDPSLWVYNPYTPAKYGWAGACAWDLDDDLTDYALGQLAADASAADTRCLIAGTQQWQNEVVQVSSSVSTLLVALAFAPQGYNVTIPAHPDGRRFLYQWCMAGPHYSNGSTVPQSIAGSNGGTGVVSSATLTVSNPTRKTQKGIGAYFEVGRATQGLAPCVTDGTPDVFSVGGADFFFQNP